MAILEKEVWVGLNHMNISYYEGMSYVIPRRKDKNGRMTIPRGTKILVKIEDLQESSNVHLTKICDEDSCGKYIINQPFHIILKARKNGDGKDRCNKCASKKGGITQKDNVKYDRSLEYWAKNNSREYLLDEFSRSNQKKPNLISQSTSDQYLWNCPKCKSQYPMSVANRTSKSATNCPYCAGHRVNNTNCIQSTHCETALLLKDERLRHTITAGSNRNEIFKCDNCGFEEGKIVCNVVKQGFRCSKCSDGISFGEKIMFNVIEQLGDSFVFQKMFDWSNRKKYDFYIPSHNLIVEVHGKQHYNEEGFGNLGGRSLTEEKNNDDYKMKLAFSNAILNYIVIDCRESKFDYIKTSIINSNLSSFYNLDHIDWLKTFEHASKTLVKTACDLWNSGIENTREIGQLLKISGKTVRQYLKQGKEIGWCNYDVKDVVRKNNGTNGKKSAKQVIQLTKTNDYIKTWESITEVESTLGINASSISAVCKGKRKTAGRYQWMYKEDYDKQFYKLNENN